MKKYMILFNDFKPVIAKNLCTIYYINSQRSIELYNFSYVKSKDLFVFSKFINLPKELILRYQYACENINELIEEMEAIGIINFKTVEEKIKNFEAKKFSLEYNNYKDKLLKRKNNKAKSLELISEINNLREQLINNYADDK